MIMISAMVGVWFNWFNVGTGFWECNRVWNRFVYWWYLWEGLGECFTLFVLINGFTLWVLHYKVFKEENSSKQLFWHFLDYM